MSTNTVQQSKIFQDYPMDQLKEGGSLDDRIDGLKNRLYVQPPSNLDGQTTSLVQRTIEHLNQQKERPLNQLDRSASKLPRKPFFDTPLSFEFHKLSFELHKDEALDLARSENKGTCRRVHAKKIPIGKEYVENLPHKQHKDLIPVAGDKFYKALERTYGIEAVKKANDQIFQMSDSAYRGAKEFKDRLLDAIQKGAPLSVDDQKYIQDYVHRLA